MPVTMPSPPADSLRALARAIEGSPAASREYLGAAAGAPSAWLPQKLYTIDVQDLADGKPIGDVARDVGWRYVLPQPLGAAVSAEVRPDAAGRHRVAHFAQGPQTLQTLELTRQLVEEPRFAAEEYTLQALIVPALYILALWLKNPDPDRDWFVPVEPTDPRLVPGRYYESPAFNDLLRSLAQERMRHPTPEM